jgi:hypothetical protein
VATALGAATAEQVKHLAPAEAGPLAGLAALPSPRTLRPRLGKGWNNKRGRAARQGPGSALVVIPACGYADLVLGDLVHEAVLIGDTP